MSNSDDLSFLKSEPLQAAVTKLEELMAQRNRAFLIGAGCSKCANLPLTEELTTKALDSPLLGEDSKKILEAIKGNFEGATNPNIEDYLSELVDHIAISERRTTRGSSTSNIQLGADEFDSEALAKAVEEIKKAIAKEIEQDVHIDNHWNFIKAVHHPLREGRPKAERQVDYLVLNYDTLIEDSLALEQVPFADGMNGGVTGWWNPATFEKQSTRVLKLHGSINWSEFPNEKLPRRIAKSIGESSSVPKDSRIVIWPASTKYRETQRDPYAQLAARAREVLRHPCTLVTCGYSFNDSHINIELDHALRESNKQLTVIAFTSNDAPQGILKEWLEDGETRDQVMVFANKGFWHGETVSESSEPLPWWKFETFTRILGGER